LPRRRKNLWRSGNHFLMRSAKTEAKPGPPTKGTKKNPFFLRVGGDKGKGKARRKLEC